MAVGEEVSDLHEEFRDLCSERQGKHTDTKVELQAVWSDFRTAFI